MKSAKHHRALPLVIGRSEPLEVIHRPANEFTPDPTGPWALTGGGACDAASGRSFNDLAREAEAANAP